MINPLKIAKTGNTDLFLLPRLANRHGLVTGATGTGKTVTLQTMAEAFSDIGVSVFMADVKGDLSGIAVAGGGNPKVEERNKMLGAALDYKAYPVAFWDVFGKSGHPLRTTISDMGPLLLARLLNLNDTQAGVLTLIFKVADDSGMLLLDLKDLRALVQHVGDNAGEYTTEYGNISRATIGSIQRGLLELETQGGDTFFGEPMLNIFDLIQNGTDGRGMINILAADVLYNRPKLYATFLLWLLAELYENLPEVGDLEKPKIVFFFDEAHLLFEDAPSALLEKVEQVVRLIRSKGVGVYFVTQNPIDIPDKVLAQLGNRVQHALRAFTPKDQKAIKAMAENFRPNPAFDIEQVITELGVGEALVSFLDEKGAPAVTERAFVYPPHSQLGIIDSTTRQNLIKQSIHFGTYETTVDRESAYETLKKRTQDALVKAQSDVASQQALKQQEIAAKEQAKETERVARLEAKTAELEAKSRAKIAEIEARAKAKQQNSGKDVMGKIATSAARSAMSAIGYQVGRQILRGILGSIGGSSKKS